MFSYEAVNVANEKDKSLIDESIVMEMQCTMTLRSAALQPPNKPMGSQDGDLDRRQEEVEEEEDKENEVEVKGDGGGGGPYPCETSPNKDSLFLGPDNPPPL